MRYLPSLITVASVFFFCHVVTADEIHHEQANSEESSLLNEDLFTSLDSFEGESESSDEIEALCSSCQNDCCDEGGFFFNGWISQGFTGNTDSPANRFNTPLTFNDRSNEYQMNQLYLSMGREVNTSCCSWDIGGRVDLLYGTDYFFTQSTGLETRRDGTPRWNSSNGPRGAGAALYGLAMPQLYAEVFAPVGNGVTVKMGHFYTILGYESVMAPENFFYSHAFTMQYGEPFTHTGLLASYDISSCLTFHGGFTRGWDNWEDNNEELGFLGGVTWTSADELTSLAFSLHSGDEDANGANNRTAYSIVYNRDLGCGWTYVLQHDFGVEANAASQGANLIDARWYGINQYLFYSYCETLDFGARVEWFRDEQNARVLAIPTDQVTGGNYTGVTIGANWKPYDCINVRPEIRWDHSNVNASALNITGMYDGFTSEDQLTLAVDVIYRF